MKTDRDCYHCFVKQAIDGANLATTDEKLKWEILLESVAELQKFDPANNHPVRMGAAIHRIVRRISGNRDPYEHLKAESNKRVKDLLPWFETLINESPDKFLTALKLLVVVNIIDFGPALSNVADLEGFIRQNLKRNFFKMDYLKSFIDDFNKASNILYLTDNSGEILVDQLFISKFLTGKKVYLAVRGNPIINDVTREDLSQLVFPANVTIIDNGADLPGTSIDVCSDSFKKIFYEADMVIAKGQGNFETLDGIDRKKVYSLFIAKCKAVTDYLGCELGDFQLLRL